MGPVIRYEAAILRDDHILMVKMWEYHFTGWLYWLIPGFRRLPDESEEACVIRGVMEQTNVEVEVVRLLLEAPIDNPGRCAKTYLCRILRGEPQPMYLETDTPEKRSIQEIGWFDLRYPESWDQRMLNDPVTLKKLNNIRAALGHRE